MADRDIALRRHFATPEGLDLGVVLGDAGQRAAAFILDGIIIAAVLIALTVIVIFGIFAMLAVKGGEPTFAALAIIWLLGLFLLRNGYFIGFELRGRAATPGKRAMGIRVIARDGGPLTADAVIARNLMREIEVFLPLSFLGARAAEGIADHWTALFGLAWTGIFLLFPLFNRDRLRIGDLLAGTWVVRSSRRALSADLIDRAAATPATRRFSEAQLGVYGEYELQTLEAVLRQANPEALQAVARTIAERIGWQEPIADPQALLSDYYAALRPQLERRMLFGRRKRDKLS